MKILIVEDEPKTGAYMKRGLAEAGFTVDLAADGLVQQADQLGCQQNGKQGNEGCARCASEFPYHRTLKSLPARHFDFFEGEKG